VYRRSLTAALALGSVLVLAACTSSAQIESDQRAAAASSSGTTAVVIDTSPGQSHRVHTDQDEKAGALVPADVAADGTLTVGVVGTGEPPLGFLADDNSTVVGSEVDIASLVAEALGLQLDVRNISWEQWPLSVQSGDVEAVFSNVASTPRGCSCSTSPPTARGSWPSPRRRTATWRSRSRRTSRG